MYNYPAPATLSRGRMLSIAGGGLDGFGAKVVLPARKSPRCVRLGVGNDDNSGDFIEFRNAVQSLDFDDEEVTNDNTTQLLDQVSCSFGRTAYFQNPVRNGPNKFIIS